MACSCNKKKGVEVKASNGRTVYTSTSITSAWAVAKRYPGAAVWQDGKQLDPPAGANTAPATPAPAPAAPAAPPKTI
ncbi:hypothetical protein ACFY0G_02265 [Streptomyces sp. NPDC001552]|uniref:hypothetical protein n=1 Tax=Streptomyces sp. NPDC001552 TaxID=3364587 RepID=UPI0036C02E30